MDKNYFFKFMQQCSYYFQPDPFTFPKFHKCSALRSLSKHYFEYSGLKEFNNNYKSIAPEFIKSSG